MIKAISDRFQRVELFYQRLLPPAATRFLEWLLFGVMVTSFICSIGILVFS